MLGGGGRGGLVVKGKAKSGRLGQGGIIRVDHMIKNIKFDIFEKHNPSRHNSFPKSLCDTKET